MHGIPNLSASSFAKLDFPEPLLPNTSTRFIPLLDYEEGYLKTLARIHAINADVPKSCPRYLLSTHTRGFFGEELPERKEESQ